MAVSQLNIYNAALIEAGASVLNALGGTRDEEDSLNVFYTDHDLPLSCLQTAKPRFACKTVKTTGAATAGGVTLAYTHTMPGDYLDVVGVYSDSDLNHPVSRYILDGNTILCDYQFLYIRYVRNDIAVTAYTPLFLRYLVLSLAEAIAPKYAPDRVDGITTRRNNALELLISEEGEKEPEARAPTPSTDLSADWRIIYNGALQILGQRKLSSAGVDDSRRSALDTTLESGVVRSVLMDTNWRFGSTLVKIEYDPDLSPTDFGFKNVFQMPADMLRRTGVYKDEFARVPLDDYHEEDNKLFCQREVIYVSYVDADWVDAPATWPTDFRRLVMARMALDACLEIDATKYQVAEKTYNDEKNTAIGNDVAQRPPTAISGGSWVTSRWGRGGDY